MPKKLILFDFDGTIADTLKVALDIANELADEFEMTPFTQAQLISFKSKHIKDFLAHTGLDWYQLPKLVKRGRKLFKKYIPEVKPIKDMPKLLRELKKQNISMGILTSNTKSNVKQFLALNELEIFDFISSPNSIFGKAAEIKKIGRKRKLQPGELLMIGDEVRDIEAANNAGIESVAVSWGFNSPELLSEMEPTRLVSKVAELKEAIETL